MAFALDRSTFTAWLDAYKAAWETRDPSAVEALFTDDATYRENPFEEPFQGATGVGDYWARVTAGQRDITFTYELFAVEGDTGYCRWHAAFTADPGDAAIDLDGVFRCVFAEAGKVRTFEEWWHIKVVPASEAA